MRAYVGVTDLDWYSYLAAHPEVTEVNFWRPGGGQPFKALTRGEPFLFKTKAPDNRLVGGGFFEGFVRLKLSEAWDFFGGGNGVSTLEELRASIGRYRSETLGKFDDPEIGCVLLNDVKFVREDMKMSAPSDFSPYTVQGKGYPVNQTGSNPQVDLFVQNLALAADPATSNTDGTVRAIPGPVFGEPRLMRPRLGQGGFKSLVREAYDRRCAVTGHKIVPTLQAAHIVPVSEQGEHRVDNGLLLRSDVHTMFDRGYLGVAPDFSLHVSPRLRSEFGNGEEFYSRAGESISLPKVALDRPNTEFLEWHMDTVFRAS